MNLKHPYEKHLAEKLVQLTPPGDPDQNWQQMKTLLEEDMPRGGGMLGGYRWVLPAVIILAIGSGIWFGGRQFLPMNRGDDSMAGTINKTRNHKASGDNGNQKAAGGTVTPPPETSNATVETPGTAPSETNQKDLVAGGDVPTAIVITPATPEVQPQDQKEFARSRSVPEKDQGTVAATITEPVATTTSNNNEINADRKKIYSKKKNSKRKPNNHTKNNLAVLTDKKKQKPVTTVPAVIETVAAAEEPEEEPTSFVSLPTVRLHKPSVRNAPKSPADLVKESPVDIIVDYTGTTLIIPSGVLQRSYTHLSTVELFPDLAVQNKSSRRRSGRSYEAHSGRTLAIGISLPLGFPLGDQVPLAYNRQAGANTVSDYIPSPHLQYHINGRTYFQTQVQLSQPQFIRPILLYQDKMATAQTNTFIYHSIYARKLYYFNLPVSVYHSPMRNFYMGTGLQFSSMLSGVALTEQRRVSPGDEYIIDQSFSKFGNDSLSRRFNNSEVRLLLDMNYYWNRFIVGLQYNQAFNNYVSFQVNPTSPYIFDKNKSLQFYLRYNIWEDRKRKRKSENVLTLK